MIKMTAATEQDSLTSNESGFPITLDEQALKRDILMLYIHQMRTMAWMMDSKDIAKIWAIAGVQMQNPSDIFNPEILVDQWDSNAGEISFSHIEGTTFAKCLWNMYQYGYLGVLDESYEPLDYETTYTMMSAILHDLAQSYFLQEFDGYVGGEEPIAARNMLKMAELANARRLLEGHQPFSFFTNDFVVGSELSNGRVEGSALSIRQMALLAGMEEMSIRAAANKQKQRAVPLPTFSEEKDPITDRPVTKGRTLIRVEDAMIWLKAKGRYVPISRKWETGDVDLYTRKFQSLDDATHAVIDRLKYLSITAVDSAALSERAGSILGNDCLTWFDPHLLKNQQNIAPLADLLQFPVELFSLRLREAIAKNELNEVERALREMNQKQMQIS